MVCQCFRKEEEVHLAKIQMKHNSNAGLTKGLHTGTSEAFVYFIYHNKQLNGGLPPSNQAEISASKEFFFNVILDLHSMRETEKKVRTNSLASGDLTSRQETIAY